MTRTGRARARRYRTTLREMPLAWTVRSHAWLGQRVLAAGRPDRGDVPGWVLVTLMTAGIVTALWVLAKPLLENLFQDAVEGVHG